MADPGSAMTAWSGRSRVEQVVGRGRPPAESRWRPSRAEPGAPSLPGPAHSWLGRRSGDDRRARSPALPGRRTAVEPASTEFLAGVARVAAASRSGADPAHAWRHGLDVAVDDGLPRWCDLRDRSGGDVAAARSVLAAARLAAEVGAPTAALLDRVVGALARDAEAAAQRRAALAAPRATARLLAWLPAVGILLGLALGADPFAVLLDGRAGSGLLAAGALLSILGRIWTGRHVAAALAAGREG